MIELFREDSGMTTHTQPELDPLRDSKPIEFTEQWSCVV